MIYELTVSYWDDSGDPVFDRLGVFDTGDAAERAAIAHAAYAIYPTWEWEDVDAEHSVGVMTVYVVGQPDRTYRIDRWRKLRTLEDLDLPGPAVDPRFKVLAETIETNVMQRVRSDGGSQAFWPIVDLFELLGGAVTGYKTKSWSSLQWTLLQMAAITFWWYERVVRIRARDGEQGGHSDPPTR